MKEKSAVECLNYFSSIGLTLKEVPRSKEQGIQTADFEGMEKLKGWIIEAKERKNNVKEESKLNSGIPFQRKHGSGLALDLIKKATQQVKSSAMGASELANNCIRGCYYLITKFGEPGDFEMRFPMEWYGASCVATSSNICFRFVFYTRQHNAAIEELDFVLADFGTKKVLFLNEYRPNLQSVKKIFEGADAKIEIFYPQQEVDAGRAISFKDQEIKDNWIEEVRNRGGEWASARTMGPPQIITMVVDTEPMKALF